MFNKQELTALLGIMEAIGLSQDAVESIMLGPGGLIDEHKHKCPTCGFVWEHTQSQIKEHLYPIAHTCLNCGTEERQRYYGTEPSSCFYDGQTTQAK